MSESAPSLADQTLARLRGYAKGNGIAPDSIRLEAAKEAVYDVEGLVFLTPDFHVESRSRFGRLREKDRKLFPSFALLTEEVARRRAAFEKEGAWLADAVKELEKTPGRGWGADGSKLYWGDQNVILAATENCPSCRGTAQMPCRDCHGIGTTMCLYCDGRGQETCPHCSGRGEDPANPQKPCPVCEGRRFINCRYCQATGKIPCTTCQGKGNVPCPDCQGTGALTQEALLSAGVRVSFSLGQTTDLPSALLRQMDRLGEANLPQQADIAIVPTPEAETLEERQRIKLRARLSFAEIGLKIGTKTYPVTALGKRARLSGVPAFLDAGLVGARKKLAAAAKGGMIDKALTARLMQDALALTLSGKTNTNDLRRLYPVGLSGGAAQEIMGNFALAIRAYTMKARGFVGAALLLLCGGAFAGFFFTPLCAALANALPPWLHHLVEIAIPLAAMGLSYLALHGAAHWALKRKYPQIKLAAVQNIGKIGYGTLIAIGSLYVALFFLATRG